MRRGRRLDLLRRCRDEFGTAIILITDNMGIVADLADRVDVMYPGDVLKELRAEQPLPAPKHPYTQRLLAPLPVPDSIEQGRRRSALAAVKAAE